MLGTSIHISAADFSPEVVAGIENKIHYTFRDKALLRNAFTHKSYTNEANGVQTTCGQLEWLGDSKLNSAVSDLVFLPSHAECMLTDRRKAKTNNAYLARVFDQRLVLTAFVKANSESLHSGAPTVYADSLEALIGAIFLDSPAKDDGERHVLRFVKQHVMPEFSVPIPGTKTIPQFNARKPAVPLQTKTAAPSTALETASKESGNHTLSKKQLRELRPQADRGDKEACMELANHYLRLESDQEAWKWLVRANNAEALMAMADLKDKYPIGSLKYDAIFTGDLKYSSAQDLRAEAIRFLKVAADQGDNDAQYELGDYYLKEFSGLASTNQAYGYDTRQESLTKAVDYLYKAAFKNSDAKEALLELYKLAQLPQNNQKSLLRYASLFQTNKNILDYWLYIDRAQADDSEALRVIADLLLNEKISYQDKSSTKPKGFQYLLKLANLNDAVAQFDVAKCCSEGNGTTLNMEEAASWYKKAAENGYNNALIILGDFYMNGTGVIQDMEQAKIYYERAANKGIAGAREKLDSFKQREITSLYGQIAQLHNQSGSGYEKNKQFDKAAAEFKKAAGLNDAEGSYNYARMLRSGRGVRQDESESKEFYKKAIALGHPSARLELAEFHEFGSNDVQKMKAKIRWEIINSDRSYGRSYQINRDLESKLRAYKEKLDRSFESSSYSSSHSEREAFPLYEVLSQTNEAIAEWLGVWYFKGKGPLSTNPTKAFELWQKAANLGSRDAQTYVGFSYLKGNGVAVNAIKAKESFENAADWGDPYAMYCLGLMYGEGKDGFAKNDILANTWIEKALTTN